jgi:hypothetical protein
MMIENKYNIQSKVFLEILAEEERLRTLKNRFPIGSAAWNSVWDKLDKVLKRKKAYEAAVMRYRSR